MPTIVVAVSHKEYRTMSLAELTSGLRQGGVFTDVKSTMTAGNQGGRV